MTAPADLRVLERRDVPRLFEALRAEGRRVLGPTVRDGAIVYDELHSVEDLPAGWTDEQEAGVYRLKRRNDAALFGYTVGPHSWKKHLFPARTRLFSADRTPAGFAVRPEAVAEEHWAFLGVRSCELHALLIQDRVLQASDPLYRGRRARTLVVAVQCGQAGGTCFCHSMGTGPHAASAFDLALTEVLHDGAHFFLVQAGSPAGQQLMDALPTRPAQAGEAAEKGQAERRAVAQMGRTMDTRGIRELLQRNPEHPRWDQVAQRCLTCANCTLACPTCFCSTVEDVTDLTGDHAERWRRWDSCFNLDFSYMHGGSVRTSARGRYRQWMTHKLSTWFDQFGSSGCVGCGRCITWCPTGIDITEEVRAIRESDGARGKD